MTIGMVLALLCGLALFLYGVTLLGDGLNKIAGGKFEAILARLIGSPVKSVLIGAVFHGRFKGKDTDVPTTDFWDTVKYFGRHEFACKCGKCGGYPVEPKEALIRRLDSFRERVDEPVYINSGIRCPEHNAAVGGATDSRHLYGDAADIRCEGKSPEQLYEIANEIFCDGGVGLYNWGIHVDARTTKSRWIG